MKIIKKGFYYLIPGSIEKELNSANRLGNLGYYGVFLRIKQHRNLVYITGLCSTVLYLYDLKKFGSICFFTQLGIYFYALNEWNNHV